SRALLEMLGPLDFRPDVIHLHDWQGGLVSNMLDRLYGDGPLSDVATALTIHNLSAQGVYGFGALTLAGLEKWGLMRVGIPGLDLVRLGLPAILGRGLHVVVMGTGDRRYEDMFRRVASEKRGTVAAVIGFDPALAQRIYAGADMLWMPSRFEPCGLAQLIALRYGTIPVVRETGGLADTIRDYEPVSATGNGFTFDTYDAWQFFAGVVRAAETFRHPTLWSWL